MIHLAGTAPALAPLAANSGGGGGSALTSFLPLILIVVVFFFLIIRPQRKRQAQMREVQQSLRPGVEVQTTFGMFATVMQADEDVVVLEIAPGVHSRFVPAVVARVVSPVDTPLDGSHEAIEDPDEHPDAPGRDGS